MTHVIVTGGSSGIGLAIAGIYARRGAYVSILARTPATLIAAHAALVLHGGAGIHAEIADVADPQQTGAAIARCEAVHGPCDILVACAGIVVPGTFDSQAPNIFDSQLAVNFSGVVHAARTVYPGMKRRRAGKIMIVSSGAGLMGIYGYSAYCASKFALRGFAEALRAEARPEGVTVSICYPPDTHTPQFAAEVSLRPPEAQAVIGTVRPWDADAVARRIVAGIDRGQFEVFIGLQLLALGRFGSLVRPLLDRWFDRLIRKVRAG